VQKTTVQALGGIRDEGGAVGDPHRDAHQGRIAGRKGMLDREHDLPVER
jgi:hypothetical protein